MLVFPMENHCVVCMMEHVLQMVVAYVKMGLVVINVSRVSNILIYNSSILNKLFNLDNLLSIFKEYKFNKIITTFENKNFKHLSCIGALVGSRNNEKYYAVDSYLNYVVFFDGEWSFLREKWYKSIEYLISVDNFLFICGEGWIKKIDLRFNVIESYLKEKVTFYGLDYDKKTNILYVISDKNVDLFDQNLKKLENIPLNFPPLSIALYQDKIIMGSSDSKLRLVTKNRKIINYNLVKCKESSSLLVDGFENMAITCHNENTTHFYNKDFTDEFFLMNEHGKWFTSDNPHDFIIDIQGRIVIAGHSGIQFYSL